MIAGLAGSFLIASCLGCATPPNESEKLLIEVGPVQPVQGGLNFQSSSSGFDPIFSTTPENEFRLPLKVGTELSPNNFAQPNQAARFSALDLTTPQPVRAMRGSNLLSAEVSFSAAGDKTGLGLDVSITPRAQIQQNRAGLNTARTGAEFRVGSNLEDRDLRGKDVPAPKWYFFYGEDNEALVWNTADGQAMDGLSLRDQATVGDKQLGVAWTTGKRAQVSIGLVERKLTWSGVTGAGNIDSKDRFAAFTYSIVH